MVMISARSSCIRSSTNFPLWQRHLGLKEHSNGRSTAARN
jgi:hypothetical protein